jgi:proteic killer suppression protein
VRRRTIIIEWADRKLAKACAKDSTGRRRFGEPRWRVLRRRIGELLAAPTLADLRNVDRFHALTADRAGQYAMSLDGAYRIVFCPVEPVPRRPDGGIDDARVDRVEIVAVVDYHG